MRGVIQLVRDKRINTCLSESQEFLDGRLDLLAECPSAKQMLWDDPPNLVLSFCHASPASVDDIRGILPIDFAFSPF